MRMSPRVGRVGWAIFLLAWGALAFWTFSLSYSSQFFKYDLPSRLPPFLAAFAGAIAIPVSFRYQFQRATSKRSSRLRAWLAHVGTAFAATVPLAVTASVLSRVRGPMHLSGDDAMGVGINFFLLISVASLSGLLLAVAFVVQHRNER